MDELLGIAGLPIEKVYETLHSTASGLSENEATKKLKIVGPNKLVSKNNFTVLKLLWDSFFSPLVMLLLVAGIISAVLGDVKDFLVIFTIVILSGGITFYQHFKANHAAEALKKKVQLTATVIRNGIKHEIPFSHLVPGDLVLLTPGDVLPADGRLIETKDLSIDESTLTGETFPAQKTINFSQKSSHSLSSLTNIVFAGTHVISGEGTCIIFATGKQTQLGQLSLEIVKAKPPTDFDHGVNTLSITLIKTILLLSAFVFGVNAFLHHEILTSFTFAVALAVGLTPELMPVILTVNLSRGALRMEKKEVIVKYLPAIQNLGSMDILCTDKTGTLTENATKLIDFQGVDGKSSEDVLLLGILDSNFKSGAKDPLDMALLHHPHSLSLTGYTKIDEIPFDFERKRASVIVKKDSLTVLITKGAPQKVLALCTKYTTQGTTKELSPAMANHFLSTMQQLNQEGKRVIAVAEKKVVEKDSYELDVEKNLTFKGFLIFYDPVKVTVAKTLKELKQLGIEVKILTGDNELVTESICQKAGIPVNGTLVSEDIEKLSEAELNKKIEQTTIFARLTPSQKEHIITLLKKQKHVVGYLGDGINDAPPLKAADVGISVNNGSDIARDVADIVLMRKSLEILQEGVQEGRKTHANIMKYIMMSLSSNFGNMISVAVASIFLPFLPLLPTQILLIDFLYDLSQITIPMDTVDTELLSKPHKWDITFIKKFMLEFGPISSIFDITTFFVLLFFLHASIPIFRTGWFIESVVTQTLIVFAIRTKRVPFFKSLPSKYVVISAVLSLSVGLWLVYGHLAGVFTFTSVPLLFYAFLGIMILIYFTFVEIGKIFFYRFLVK